MEYSIAMIETEMKSAFAIWEEHDNNGNVKMASKWLDTYMKLADVYNDLDLNS